MINTIKMIIAIAMVSLVTGCAAIVQTGVYYPYGGYTYNPYYPDYNYYYPGYYNGGISIGYVNYSNYHHYHGWNNWHGGYWHGGGWGGHGGFHGGHGHR